MFQRKSAILFSILGIGTLLGFISGVAPGYFLKSYALFAIVAAFLFFILLLLSFSAVIYEYLHRKSIVVNARELYGIFHQELSRTEKVILSLINSALFFTGAFFGVICELLFKALSAPVAVHFIIGAVFVVVLFVALLIILIVASRKRKYVQPKPRSEMPTMVVNEPKNVPIQIIRPYSRGVNEDAKSTWQNPSTDSARAPSTIQKEYQRLLNPSARFHLSEKVFVNDRDMAQIIGIDGVGIYRIQYLDNGRIDYKPGVELRKALPLID